MEPNANIKSCQRVTKDEVIDALRQITTKDANFDARYWNEADADDLQKAAAMVRRELGEYQRKRNERFKAGKMPHES